MRIDLPKGLKKMEAWKGKPRAGRVVRNYVLDQDRVTDARSLFSASAKTTLSGDLDTIIRSVLTMGPEA